MVSNNNASDVNELALKIIGDVNKAVRKLVESAAINNDKLVIADEDSNVKSVPARELPHKLQK